MPQVFSSADVVLGKRPSTTNSAHLPFLMDPSSSRVFLFSISSVTPSEAENSVALGEGWEKQKERQLETSVLPVHVSDAFDGLSLSRSLRSLPSPQNIEGEVEIVGVVFRYFDFLFVFCLYFPLEEGGGGAD